MRRLKRYPAQSRKYTKQKSKSSIIYTRSSSVNLPEGYGVENGFLNKNGTVISLSSPGLMEMAAQGFLHIDEDESYYLN